MVYDMGPLNILLNSEIIVVIVVISAHCCKGSNPRDSFKKMKRRKVTNNRTIVRQRLLSVLFAALGPAKED